MNDLYYVDVANIKNLVNMYKNEWTLNSYKVYFTDTQLMQELKARILYQTARWVNNKNKEVNASNDKDLVNYVKKNMDVKDFDENFYVNNFNKLRYIDAYFTELSLQRCGYGHNNDFIMAEYKETVDSLNYYKTEKRIFR